MGKIYAGVTEVIDHENKQFITLTNFGNLPAQFSWDEKLESDRMIARFEPQRGTLLPKTSVSIYMSMTVFFGGAINELFMCNVEDVELPLGFEVLANAFGLNVSYEISNDDAAAALSLTTSSGFRGTKTSILNSSNALND